jgi:hypothetical protein
LSVARVVLAGRGRLWAAFAPAATHWAAQEFGLLVRLLEAIATTRLAARFTTATAGRLYRSVGLTLLHCRTGPVLHGLAITISAVTPISPVAPISAVSPVIGAVTVAEAVLVAPERAITVGVVARMTVLLMLLALMLWLAVMLGHGRLRETVVQHVVAAILVAEVVAFALTRDAYALAIAVGHVAALLLQLLAIGHDDAAVVLGVLQIVLREHRVAGGLRVASERKIFLGDMCRGTADLHIRTVGFETARKRILALPIPVVAASAAILLSLPHCL